MTWVIFSSCWEDNVSHVRQVLDKLRSAGLMANPAKCHWGGTRMEFLGHLFGEGTMSVPQHLVESLASYTKPTTKKPQGVPEVSRFLSAILRTID